MNDHQPSPLPMELVLKHDCRSIMGKIVPSKVLDCHSFAFMLEGESAPRYINIPKKLIGAGLVKGCDTIFTVVITQSGLMPQLPAGLNGTAIGEH